MMESKCLGDSYKFADRSIISHHIRRMAAVTGTSGDFNLFFTGLTLQMKDAISESGKYDSCPEGRGK